MYTYMLVLNDFGIRPITIWKLSTLKAPIPNPTDVYDPLAKNFGNTNLDSGAEEVPLGWDLIKNGKIDIRLFYAAYRNEENWTNCRWDPNDTSIPRFMRYSHISGKPICYSSEALKYAQAAYLCAIVTTQVSGLLACKTRNLSLYQQGMINPMGNFGICTEITLISLLLYVRPLNVGLGTRPVPLPHFAVPSMSFFVAIFFYDELRKLYLRKGMVREGGRIRMKGWIVQNTYY
jgi:hypothetical protein